MSEENKKETEQVQQKTKPSITYNSEQICNILGISGYDRTVIMKKNKGVLLTKSQWENKLSK